jgi:hypothetical protein
LVCKRSRFEQLFRDARLGRIHPGSTLLTHELVGKLSLGINPDEERVRAEVTVSHHGVRSAWTGPALAAPSPGDVEQLAREI